MLRVGPRLVSVVATGASASAISPAPAATEALHAPDGLEEFQNSTRSPKSLSSHSSLPFNSTSSVELDTVPKEEAQEDKEGLLGQVPSAISPAPVANEDSQCLDGEQELQKSTWSPKASSSHSSSLSNSSSSFEWDFVLREEAHERVSLLGQVPSEDEAADATNRVIHYLRRSRDARLEADASIVASEQANETARGAMGADIVSRPLAPILQSMEDFVQQQPERAQRVMMSVVRDPAVLNAVRQNPEVQALLGLRSTVVLEEVNDVTGEERSGQTESQNSEDTDDDDQEVGQGGSGEGRVEGGGRGGGETRGEGGGRGGGKARGEGGGRGGGKKHFFERLLKAVKSLMAYMGFLNGSSEESSSKPEDDDQTLAQEIPDVIVIVAMALLVLIQILSV